MFIGKIKEQALVLDEWMLDYLPSKLAEIHAEMRDDTMEFYLCKKQVKADSGYSASSLYMKDSKHFVILTDLPSIHYRSNNTDFIWVPKKHIENITTSKETPNKEKTGILSRFREEEF